MGGGGTTQHAFISPHTPDMEVEACDMTGAYITLDGGESYRMFNLMTGVSTYAFDYNDPRVIYAANFGLWRSEDTGKTWSLVFPDPARTSAVINGDHGELMVKSDDPVYPSDAEEIGIVAVAVDPKDSNHICVAFDGGYAGTGPQRVYATTDYGRTWALLKALDPGDTVLALAIDPVRPILTVAASNGIYVCDGAAWTKNATPVPFPNVRPPRPAGVGAAAFGRAKDGAFLTYVSMPLQWDGDKIVGGLYLSADRGATWRMIPENLEEGLTPGSPLPAITTVACSEFNADTVYVGLRGLVLGEGPSERYNGIAKSSDRGAMWDVSLQGVRQAGRELPRRLDVRARRG